jgi:hypothetical protein
MLFQSYAPHGLEPERPPATSRSRWPLRGARRIKGTSGTAAGAKTATGATGTTAASAASNGDFAGVVDIGGGRKMYLGCKGRGSPTVVLVSGLDAAADLWNRPVHRPGRIWPDRRRLPLLVGEH